MSLAAPMQQTKAKSAPTTAQHSSRIEANKQLASIDEVHNEFADLRTHSTAQRQQQYAADQSAQSHQLKSIRLMAQNSARATQLIAIGAMKAPAVQRLEEEVALQTKSAGETLQREKMADEVADAPKAPNSNNTGLPKDLKSGIESLSGLSMSHVKVHYNSSQPAQLNAHAYAQGSEIHVAPGQEQHLPHEAWHVVQQAQGRVKPTMQMKTGVPVNDDEGLEHEADVMGAKALQTKSASSSETAPNSAGQAQKSKSPSSQGTGVTQLLGKVGSIAVGAIIGTIVPVLGTIIGGYIGYRLWKRKQRQNAQAGTSIPASTHIQAPPEDIVAPMEEKSPEELEGQRRMLEEEAAEFDRRRIAYQKRRYGEEKAKPNPRELGILIDRARGAYLTKEYQVAFDLLTNREAAARLGIDLRATEQVVTVDTDTSYREVANALATGENMMFFPDANRINLRIPLPIQVDQRLRLAEVPELAKLMLPMFLEEYVHTLQHWTKRHFSKHTDTFAEETGAGKDQEQDMDEVDVMALFHDWGFDIEGIDYVGRYKERQDYWKWLNAKKD